MRVEEQTPIPPDPSSHQESVRRLPPPTIRPGRPTVRTTFQLAADIVPGKGTPSERLRERCITSVLRWVASKLPERRVPEEAYKGLSFRYELYGQIAEGVALEGGGPWCIRLVQPDAPFRDRFAVAGRVWTTEVALAPHGSGLRFGVRITCASLPYATQEIELTRPRIVTDLAVQFELRDVHRIESHPWNLSSEGELGRFRDLLLDGRRSLPVYLLTQPDEERLGLHTAPFLLDADDLARRTFGLAHVVTLPNALGFRWTTMVGRSWSAYLGAVRTYRPG